jgi:hypothetical protein
LFTPGVLPELPVSAHILGSSKEFTPKIKLLLRYAVELLKPAIGVTGVSDQVVVPILSLARFCRISWLEPVVIREVLFKVNIFPLKLLIPLSVAIAASDSTRRTISPGAIVTPEIGMVPAVLLPSGTYWCKASLVPKLFPYSTNKD